MDTVRIVEVASVPILLFATAVAARRGALRPLATDGGLAALGGMLGELGIMHGYGFYRYSDRWSLFVSLMPVMVALIWGYVIASARDLAKTFAPGRPAWVVGLVVLTDALLIEPVASRAGLWTWDEPGLFSVPWIGVLGWGLYAMAASFCLDRPRLRPWTWLLAPAATHAMLIATWWGGLRWGLREQAPEAFLAGLGVALALAMTALAARSALPHPGVLVPRAPAGLLFFALLPLTAPGPAFVIYVVAFAVPWVVLSLRTFRAARAP